MLQSPSTTLKRSGRGCEVQVTRIDGTITIKAGGERQSCKFVTTGAHSLCCYIAPYFLCACRQSFFGSTFCLVLPSLLTQITWLNIEKQ